MNTPKMTLQIKWWRVYWQKYRKKIDWFLIWFGKAGFLSWIANYVINVYQSKTHKANDKGKKWQISIGRCGWR